jgi:hypothetical protein
MAPLRAQARASEAIVAATTRIRAYSVVWLPVSAPHRSGGTRGGVGDGTALAGMAAPLSRGQGARARRAPATVGTTVRRTIVRLGLLLSA